MRFLLFCALLLGALFYSNPTEQRLRDVMREQDQLTLTAASLLPIKRTNYYLASKFEINYLFGKTTCYGAAYTVIICPSKAKKP
jgi:TorA maturation chaperone TorD